MISAMNQSVITRSGSQRLTGMQLWRMPITYYEISVAAKFGLQTVLQCQSSFQSYKLSSFQSVILHGHMTCTGYTWLLFDILYNRKVWINFHAQNKRNPPEILSTVSYKFRFWKDSCTCLLYMHLLLYADKENIFQHHQQHDILPHMDIPKSILILCPHVTSLHSEILM